VRETRVVSFVITIYIGENSLVVKASVRLTNPSINCISEARDVVLRNRLAKTKIRLTVVRPQLYEQLRADSSDEVVCER